jgi:predicted transcriptional regulator
MTTITLKVTDEWAAHLPASEAEREVYALAALKEKIEMDQDFLRDREETVAAVKEGLADVDAGRTYSLEECHEKWRAQRREREARRAAGAAGAVSAAAIAVKESDEGR